MFLNKRQQVLIVLGLCFWYVFGIGLMFYFTGGISSDDFTKFNVIYFISSSMFFATTIAFVGSKKLSTQGAVGKSLFLIGLAILFDGLGFFAWFVSETLLRSTELYPAPADIFYVLFYPIVSIGLFFLLKIYSLNITRFKLIQAFVLAVLAGILMFNVFDLSLPSFSEEDSFFKSLFDLFYTFTDILLIGAVIVTLRLAGGKIFKGLFIFLLGLVFNVAGDLTFFSRIENGTYYTGDISDLFFAFSGLALAIGVFFIVSNFTSQIREA